MNTSVNTLPSSAANTKPLWAAVGVLGVAVLALGASLVYVQSRPVDGHTALATVAPALQAAVAPTLQAASAPVARVAATESLSTHEDLVAPPPKPSVALPKPPPPKVHRPAPAAAAGPVAATTTPAPAPAPLPAPTPAPVQGAVTAGTGSGATSAPSVVTDAGVVASQPVMPVARPVCANCGTIESATPVQRKGSSSGVGTVAGGVVGAVLGNQVGKGSGRTVATILGAVGGGFAGNAIEKNVKKETVYQVRVRMEDGSVRTIEQAALPQVGAKVTVDGGVVHSADGGYSSVTAPKPPAPTPTLLGTNRS